MIVHELDLVSTAVSPDEAHPPLIADANAVPALPVGWQAFKPVARRNAQVIERRSSIQHSQLPTVGWREFGGETFRHPAEEHGRYPLVAEALDHAVM